MAQTIYAFDFKRRSREWYIANEIINGKSREETLRELFPRVGERKPFIYEANVGMGRDPKPLADQYRLFIYSVATTIKAMEKQGWDNPEPYSDKRRWTSKERVWVRWRKNYINDLVKEGLIRDPETGEFSEKHEPSPPEELQETIPEPGTVTPVDINGQPLKDRELIAERVEPPKPPKPKTRSDFIDVFYTKLMIARDFVVSRELSGEFLDFISTRALKDGVNAIAHGIHLEAVMDAVTKTWPDDSKRELERHTRVWTPPAPAVDISGYEQVLEGAHSSLGYVFVLAKARIPIFLVGPTGCGKSFMARDLAEALECDYGEIPLTAGATPSWLVGAETISGYRSRPFIEIYGNGGVFCFEEMDAADPNMLLLVNNALANESFTNPVTGKEIEKSRDFIAVATANTWGLGANRQYTGRERLDAATLDRWRVGRIEMDYDEIVEKSIVQRAKKMAAKFEKTKKARA